MLSSNLTSSFSCLLAKLSKGINHRATTYYYFSVLAEWGGGGGGGGGGCVCVLKEVNRMIGSLQN